MSEVKNIAPIPSDVLDLYRKVQNSTPDRGWKWTIPLFHRIANAEADRNALLEALSNVYCGTYSHAACVAGRAAIALVEQHKKGGE